MSRKQGIAVAFKTVATLLMSLWAATSDATTELYYVHADHLGTPQVMTDKNQDVVWKRSQTPFGETVEETGTLEQPLRFPGQYQDRETGFSYNYYRDYDPGLGRYIQSDPIGLRGGVNTYGYALQNPIKYTDPKGLAVPAAIVACAANPFCREAARRTAQACANLAGAAASSIWGAWNESSGTRSLDDLDPIHDADHPQNDPDIGELTDDELIDALTNPRNGDRVTVKGNKVYDGNTRVNEAKKRGFDGSTEIPVDELPNPPIDNDDPLGPYR